MTTLGGDNLKQFQYQVCAPCRPYILCMLDRRVPPWWSQAGENGTKLLYQAEQDPLIYIVPVSSISSLGRLPVVAGDHGTIPAAMRNSRRQLFKHGKCYMDRHPGSGSKLYYINPSAMRWPSDYPKRPLAG